MRCVICRRPLLPERSIALYGESEGGVTWQDGPYGRDCAYDVALLRWKEGRMTYRRPPGIEGWVRSAYRFPGVPFGARRASA